MKTYFSKHLDELKLHLILISLLFFNILIISYIYSEQWIYILIKPLLYLKESNYFIFTDITEIFYVKIIISIIISIFVIIIIGIIQFLFFISPGMYKKDNIIIIKTLLIYLILLFLSFFLIYKFLIPYTWKFFIGFENISYNYLYNIFFEPKIYDYICFIINIYILIIIFLQYIYLIIILLLFKPIFLNKITKFRKLFYLKILIIASLVAPPDIGSQLLIFFFFLILIELLLLYIYILKK